MKNKKEHILRLKKEIQIKDFIIKELMVIITEYNVKLPETLIKNMKILYSTGEEHE